VRGVWIGVVSYPNCLFGNSITNSEYGLWLDHAFYAAVYGNNIANNEVGIAAWVSNDNRICSNNISQSSFSGITMVYCDNNVLYHNNMNNPEQIHMTSSLNNTWDDGYPSGGNFWSDYNGTDQCAGPYQNITGSDGMGDTPYVIDASNKDNYPFLDLCMPAIDIAVMNVTSSKSIVGQGYTTDVCVTITNQGSIPQPFIITLYANASLIHTQTIVLESNTSITSVIQWNTTGSAKGNYSITAVANISVGEINVTNNALADGWMYVGLPGDVNGNHIVNMLDLYYIALNFGKNAPYASPQIANCDIDNNGIINMVDLYIAALHFGQSEP
jgi:parallel beta-helix repeat protein